MSVATAVQTTNSDADPTSARCQYNRAANITYAVGNIDATDTALPAKGRLTYGVPSSQHDMILTSATSLMKRASKILTKRGHVLMCHMP